MALSPENPPGAPPPSPNAIGAFVGGIVLGLVLGGTVLMLLFVALAAGIVSMLFPKSTGNWYPLLAMVPAFALGWWAVMRTRKSMSFFSGMLIGLAAGTLGGTALCAITLGGLGNL